MLAGTANAAEKAKGRRATLSVRHPLIERSLLAGEATFDGYDIDEARQFGNALMREVYAWYRDRDRHNSLLMGVRR